METIRKKIAVNLLRAGYPEPEEVIPLAGDASNRSYMRRIENLTVTLWEGRDSYAKAECGPSLSEGEEKKG
jgi:hypothetical protein